MVDIDLRKRLLKLLYDHNEEHVGSCFTCLEMIDDIYTKKQKDDVFILSNGHAQNVSLKQHIKHMQHVRLIK